ncbi:MAG: hypothetical protein WD071_02650 [Pseudohongiella sp.]|uniref:hypothetical protein n=1 Tax=Pseudohongiella sp. TaxID=1979412 RepID=UPI0034A03CB8
MKVIIASSLIFMMSIVINREQILEDIPIGLPESEMMQYFQNLNGDLVIGFYDRESSHARTVNHELQHDEKGYYIVTIRGVRSSWWQPSMGKVLIPLVVISNENTVKSIKFFGGRVGWP